ncbi:MAG: ATP-binding protein [Candidatus Aminicenantes bacterium]|nr:ATP-binding protein [Candidatus Aminicenantes bacterium]
MGLLGWQMLKQDRALEGQRMQERLELAADQMAVGLEQSLIDLEKYLSFVSNPGVQEPPDDVMVLKVTKHTVTAYPPGCLLYYPVIPEAEEPPDTSFVAGEILEYQYNNPAKAAEVFRKLTRSPDPGVRAGALLRLGRNLRKTGRHEEALQAYSELAQLGHTTVLGLPAELTAREARGTVLEAIGRREELREEASLLHTALWSGRWSLLHPAWKYHVEEAQRWLEPSPMSEREQHALALSIATDSIYAQWITEPESKGRQILKIEGQPVLISWAGTTNHMTALLAGPGYLVSNWKEILQGQRVQGALVDADGQVMIGSFNKNSPQAIRTAPATRLPWSLHATSPDPGADEEGFVGRRRLLLSGFAVLALVLLAGSYFIIRSIDRERAVARLQSEFVSAVSHEFRTPLTSLRHLSEMLSKGRVPTEDLRQQSFDILACESARLQSLVESLLDFGRIEARSFRYQYEHLNPVKLVSDLVAEFQEKTAAQGYRVELAHAGEYPFIRADREALGLALRNLLDNAVKYSPDCRTIWIEMARERGRLAIRVRDQGIGIPVSEQKEIFKRFVRGTGSMAANIQGTGIGLAMARQIIEAHNGEIRLESEPGRGSTFTILLPLEKKV